MAEAQVNPNLQATPDVHKFGGSSLRDAAGIAQVIAVIKAQVKLGDFVVVSANGHVTDLLLAFIRGEQNALDELYRYLNQLLKTSLQSPEKLLEKIQRDLKRLSQMIDFSGHYQHQVLALGELWSAQLLSAKLTEEQLNNHWLDASEWMVVDEQNHLANRAAAKQRLMHANQTCNTSANGLLMHVVTGFIASDLSGNCMTLGRNGSDYTATIMADLLDSAKVYLWTDVAGVYSADPNVVNQALPVAALTTGEAQALAELGSHVLHQKTMAPIMQQATRLVINNCAAKSAGTVVSRIEQPNGVVDANQAAGQVKTLAHKSNLVFFSVHDVDELKARQFQTQLTVAQINNYANHCDKTQQRLSFYVEHDDLFKITQLIKSFGLQIEKQLSGFSLVSAVGQNIRQNHQVITQLLNRSARFDVHNIHYPSNDHTLCVLLPDEQATQLLHDLHQTFFALTPSMPIVVLGYGNIGQQFLKILKANKASIEKQVEQSLSVLAVANSRSYQFNESCLLDQNIELDQVNSNGELLQALAVYAGQPLVVIDLTASDWVAEQYLAFANNGWHIISANKVAAANCDYAQRIEHSLKQHRRLWLKNTTVGAALPIQDAIRKLKASGDPIKQVSGVFSGSLSWLFGQYDGQTDFMQWVKQAHQNAYTEPDPRDDLSGQDVYRKAWILAQELGFEPKHVEFNPVLPEHQLAGSLDDFWNNPTAANEYIKTLWQAAKDKHQQLCYLASVTADELRVELVAIAADHAAAGLKPGDNIFIIESAWYSDNPLVIQGPGAGREVTAAGVLTDLIEVLQSE